MSLENYQTKNQTNTILKLLKNWSSHLWRKKIIIKSEALNIVRKNGLELENLPTHFKNNTGVFLLLNKKHTMDKDILTLVGLEKHIKKGEK